MDSVGAGTLLVIAKDPAPGRVKTRLCPPCTAEQASSVASAALEDTFAAVNAADPARRVVAFDGAAGPWIPAGYEVVEQVRGGLGERLDAAFRWVSCTGDGASPMMVLGMDTPQVSSTDISDSLRVLGEPGVDAVLGPALDGGYWTVGFTAEVVADRTGLFEGVPMSTSRTAEAQVALLESLGLNCRILRSIRDIDTWTDAVAVAEEFPDLATSMAVTEVLNGAGAIVSETLGDSGGTVERAR
jgi:rSAM/selenodomain-associated transferase 1